MRMFLFAGVAVAAAVSSMMVATAANARDYPFCIKGDIYDSPVGDCSFATYAQCAAAASGRLAYCDANPFYAAPRRTDAAGPRKRSRPH